MAILDDVKLALRISSTAFDAEINDLIAGARQDLILSGIISIKAADDSDPLIKRAIVTYCKANFGYDNPDADRLNKSYDLLKNHLSLAYDYNAYSVTFTIISGIVLLENVTVIFNSETKITNTDGVAKFVGVKEQQNMDYVVSLNGYLDVTGEVDVDGNKTVNIEMTVGD